MSFDIYLERPKCDHCGRGPDTPWQTNLTHNVNKIVDACLMIAGSDGQSPAIVGMDRSDYYWNWSWGRLGGWTGKDAAPCVRRALEASRDPIHLDRFRAMEPANGWGTLEVVQEVFQELHEACLEYHDAMIRVSG